MKKATLFKLLDSTVDGLVIVNASGEHLFVNKAFCEMVGLARSELIGRGTPHAYWPPEQLPEIVLAFADTTAGGKHDFELTFRNSQEQRFPVAVRPANVDIDGEQLIICTVIDLRERQRQRTELREMQQLLQTMLRDGDIAWWKWDLQTGKVDTSDSCYTILGYDPGEWQSTHGGWMSRVHPDDAEVADSKLQALLQDEIRVYDAEYRLQDSSGEWRWLLGRGRVTERLPDGSPAVIQGTVQDIHQLKRHEEALQQFAKMEIIGQMSGGIAHDFNNLLAIIEGNLSLLDGDSTSQLSPAARESLSDIRTAVERGETMINSLLRLARGERQTLQRIDLPGTVQATWPLLVSALPKTIRLTRHDKAEQLAVTSLPGSVESILLNLVLNARDAIGDSSGAIELRVESLRLAADKARQLGLDANRYFARIAVTDNGPGMTEEVRRHATDPLYTTKPLGVGTGLGLAVVARFAHDAGGAVDIESELGRGTTVSVFLPLDDASIDTAEISNQASVTEVAGRKERVLVVDDEQAIVKMLVAQLQRHGFDARGTDNPRSALAMILESTPDLLVTDIVMPQSIDGLELARLAKTMAPGLRIGFISGFAPELTEETLAELGPLLKKPFSGKDFISFVDELLITSREPRSPD